MRRGPRSSAETLRLDRMERRIDDLEDTLAAALASDQLDLLAQRVEELAVTAVTHDDLLRVRTDAARLAAEVTRVRAELQSELDRLAATVTDLDEPRLRRRAAG